MDDGFGDHFDPLDRQIDPIQLFSELLDRFMEPLDVHAKANRLILRFSIDDWRERLRGAMISSRNANREVDPPVADWFGFGLPAVDRGAAAARRIGA